MNFAWHTGRSRSMRKAFFLLLAVGLSLSAQQQKKQQQDEKKARDIVYEDLPDTPDKRATGAVAVPRSYAVVIGVSQYPNLEKKWQLQFTERDAESMYSILISEEGGSFRAENVHKL